MARKHLNSSSKWSEMQSTINDGCSRHLTLRKFLMTIVILYTLALIGYLLYCIYFTITIFKNAKDSAESIFYTTQIILFILYALTLCYIIFLICTRMDRSIFCFGISILVMAIFNGIICLLYNQTFYIVIAEFVYAILLLVTFYVSD